MLCSRCKKRPAVVFMSTGMNADASQGLCITCAKELGIKPVTDIMNKMGITDEDIDAVHEQFGTLMEMGDEGLEFGDDVMNAKDMPFLKNIFGDSFKADTADEVIEEDEPDKKGGKKKKKHLKRKNINAYCYNLTQKAKDGQLDRVIGREKELTRVIQILSRRSKNNPCLIGEPGVGKTAIAEALAIKIAEGNVPARLKNKEIHLLDLTSLVAGTQFRGQFEGRIKGLIEEVKADGNIILFIDEVHNLVGTGESENSINAANILKPALSRGEIQVIGATTFNEYRKYIEKDTALERRFQPVTVLEPSIQDTIDVLIGIKDYYQMYHNVTISDEMIKKSVILSERYITDRFLPDKAIDLVDEACAHAALRNKSREEYDSLTSKIDKMKEEEEELENVEGDIDYESLASLRYELSCAENKLKEIPESSLNTDVTEDDLSHVIELWTGIPSSKVKENELKKLAKIEDRLKKKIIGQDEAVEAVSAAIRRSRVQISPRRRPSSFIFVGPTGVGKTELAKVLASDLFDSPEALIRLDMSEFMEKHSVSRIIGAPPGYVGYDESGQVTEKVRRRPYSIILFDEIEKAHPDVMNILLQILDEGKVTDAHGRAVNFENTVIIMTSNAGSDKRENSLGFGKTENDMSKEKALKALNEFLRPEFISRIDEIVVFKKHDIESFRGIARLMLNEYVGTLSERGIKFVFDDNSINWLAEKAMGGKNGARDLRNLIRKEVEDKIASILVENAENGIFGISLKVDGNLKIDII